MKFQALVFDGFDELDVIGVYEPLRMAGQDVEYVSLYEQEVITAGHGTKLMVSAVLALENKPDLLIVPGGGWIARSATGAWAEANKGFVLKRLQDFYRAGVQMASVCTGSLLLARAGLLEGRRATTNHGAVDELRQCGANYMDERVVDDGDIITAAGVTSSLDLGLWLVARFVSQDKAVHISQLLEYEIRQGHVDEGKPNLR